MKAVLTSIKPNYVFLIIARAMGWKIELEKTVEVRKNFPTASDWDKKVLVYCSRYSRSFNRIPKEYQPLMAPLLGKVIGEFVCDRIYEIGTYWATDEIYSAYSDEIDDELREEGLDIFDVTCLTEEEIIEYLGTNRDGYGWHISDLKIYDKPKELSEFLKPCPFPSEDCDLMCPHAIGEYHGDGIGGDCEFVGCDNKITRPPQSWCYVEEL